jgi:hypothetical protein
MLVARLADGSVVCAGAGKTSDAPVLRSKAQSVTDSRFLRQRAGRRSSRGHHRDGRRRRRPSFADPKTLRTRATVAGVDPESALEYLGSPKPVVSSVTKPTPANGTRLGLAGC